MKKYSLTIILSSLILLFTAGCKKFVEIDPPKDQLVTTTVFKNNETANAALLTIYALMVTSTNASPYYIPASTGLYGDELTNNSSFTLEFYLNAIDPLNNNYSNAIWNSAYKFIYLANAAYESCNESTSLDPDVKKQLMGEALFIRAYWHFYLVNLYGDVPLITTTDYSKNAMATRSPKSQVYEQIISDLISSVTNLNANYVGSNGITTITDRVRPSKNTAIALLARVYLYGDKYSDAETKATILIANDALYSLETLDKVFLKESRESIWSLSPANNSSINTPEGNLFIPNSAPPIDGSATISPQLLDAFENGDLRRFNWIGKYIDVTVTPNKDYYYPYKYKVKSGSTQTEYSIIFRLAEQYLIRAEARNQQNNIAGAIADINVLRSRARDLSGTIPNALPDLESSLTKDQVKAAILHERRVELFTEQGHRWFDMKRTGIADAQMSIVAPLKGASWKASKLLWPIPQTEILNNPKLIQNPGYN